MNLSSIPTQIRDQFTLLSPPWLNQGYAEKFGYVPGLMFDLLLEKAFQAQTIRIPGAGDVSQIPYLCQDRNLVQGPAESTQSICTRLQQAFQTAKLAGSRVAIALNVQAYLQNLQPGIYGALPQFAMVSGNSTKTSWSTQYIGDAIGAPPTLMTVPANWNWDGSYRPWRSWFILYMSLGAATLGGTGGVVSSTTLPGSLQNAGTWGENLNGVWVPGFGGTPINYPFILLTGLSGLSSANVGNWLTWSGAAHAGNNGTFQITQVASATSCYIANPNNVPGDANPGTWSISAYPYIGPAPCWDFPSVKWDQGASAYATPDYGSNVGGVWESTTSSVTYQPSLSWGLSCSSLVISSIRGLLQTWKSGTTWYSQIIVAFDGGTGAAVSAFSPNSSEGSGNPDGTYGGHGKLSVGVWVPNRDDGTSVLDEYCQGTGSWSNCTVENVT
jgi:hypothetical protein